MRRSEAVATGLRPMLPERHYCCGYHHANVACRSGLNYEACSVGGFLLFLTVAAQIPTEGVDNVSSVPVQKKRNDSSESVASGVNSRIYGVTSTTRLTLL